MVTFELKLVIDKEENKEKALAALKEYINQENLGGQVILRFVITNDDVGKYLAGETDYLRKVVFSNE